MTNLNRKYSEGTPSTVVKSPRRQLEELFGYRPGSDRPTRSSWMKLNVGDCVRERDGRCTGRVEAIFDSAHCQSALARYRLD